MPNLTMAHRSFWLVNVFLDQNLRYFPGKMTSVAVDVATVHLPEDARDTAVTPPPSVTLIQQDDSRQQPTAGNHEMCPG